MALLINMYIPSIGHPYGNHGMPFFGPVTCIHIATQLYNTFAVHTNDTRCNQNIEKVLNAPDPPPGPSNTM